MPTDEEPHECSTRSPSNWAMFDEMLPIRPVAPQRMRLQETAAMSFAVKDLDQQSTVE